MEGHDGGDESADLSEGATTKKKKIRPLTMSLREAVELDGTRLSFSSGSGALDRLLGGGFRTAEMVEVFGASGTGKSQLAIQSAVSAASAGYSCAYVDCEGQFRPERLSSICESS